MKLLLDQDVYACTFRLLVDAGYDVVRAADIGLARASDEDLLAQASEMGRVLVTRDRDFGALVFLKNLGAGVIYLRIPLARLSDGHAQLIRVLATHSEDKLRAAFVVVEPGRHRFRRLPR